MKNKFKFLALAIMALLSSNVWGESIFNITSYSSIPTGWTQSSVETGSYFKLNAGGYLVSPEISAYDGLSLSFKNAKFGNGTNPQLTVQVLSSKDVVLASYTTGTPTSSTYLTFTQSLGDISQSFKIKIINPSGNAAARLQNISLSGTPATPAVTRTVTWKVNNETYTAGSPTTQVNDGAAVTTLPTAPTTDCGGKTFVGWTATANYTHATTAPGDLFSTAADAPTVSGGNKTYYAVFANASSGGGSTTETLTVGTNGGATWTNSVLTESATVGNVLFTALHSNGNSGKYYSTDNSWRFYSDDDGLTISTKDGSNITQVVITWKTGAPKTPTNWSKSGNSSPYTYTTTTNTNSVTFLRNGTNVLFQVIAVTYSGGTSYSNYTTTCATCTAISPTLSYTAAATIGQVLNPTLDKKGSSGAVTYSIKSGSSNASINASTGALTCSAAGTVTVQATIAAAGDYCEGTATSNTITISAAAYSISYNLDGGTHGTNHPTSGTIGTAFAVSPPTKEHYTFTGWQVTSGLNTSTAKWGPGSALLTGSVTSSTQKCIISTTNDIYFLDLGANDASVTLTATWEEDEKFTVTLLNNNAPVEDSDLGFGADGKKEYYTDETLGTLPTLNSGVACDATSTTFMGWTTEQITTKRAAAPDFVNPSTPVTDNMTLRAVWAKEE